MGVHGLWRLIEQSGKPVPIETLENKVLAVDVSIWLHQAIKGFQDSKGGSIPNAHLLGIYHRVCKLLYFRIRPVFIFDGGVPILKKETIAKRNNLKSKNLSETYSLQKQLLNTLLKHSAVNKVISEKAMANMENCVQKSLDKFPKDTEVDDIYKLPLAQLESSESLSEEEEEEDEQVRHFRHWDLHTIDENSTQFKSLPADVRHEILTELKETRKQSSWGRIHELPTQSDDFSIYQMKRLLKRHSVQTSLEETEKEMGGHALSLGELEALLNDHGVITANDRIGGRIASSESVRYLLIKDVKKALEEAAGRKVIEMKMAEISEEKTSLERKTETMKTNREETNTESDVTESEYEKDLKKAIQLSLQDLPSTSKGDNVLKEPESLNLKNYKDTKQNNTMLKKKILHSLKTVEEKTIALHEEDTARQNNAIIENTKIMSGTSDNRAEICDNYGRDKVTQNINSITSQKNIQNSDITIEINTNINSSDISVSFPSINTAEVPKNNQEGKALTTEFISDSDSNDSDKFIEIKEDIPHMNTLVNKKPENVLEIIIKPKENLEDDIFADVFSSEPIEDISDLQQNDGNTKAIDKETSLEKIKPVLRKSIDEEMELEIVAIEENNTDSQIINHDPENNKNVPNKIIESSLTMDQLKQIKANLISEKDGLIAEKSNKERLANNITDQMYQDAQELLQLFGVPYIIAPMEAEAQCAFLEQINLTDGTITDDSDIWLFGGKTVYKNFFNQSKHVLEFRSENIHHFFKLSRHELILLALLVGSDYTTGIQGIGPVTALEILAAFPIKKVTEDVFKDYHIVSGLQEFQKWFKQGKVTGPGRTTLRNKLKNIVLGDNFPSLQVVQAYMEPKVETSRENFSWNKPDITALADFAREKFGWSKIKSEEILKPVLKRIEETATQMKITSYFKMKHKIDIDSEEAKTKMSKRVKAAVDKMNKQHDGLSSDEDVKALKQTRKQSRKKVKQIQDEIETEVKKEIEKNKTELEKVVMKSKVFSNLHKRENIPQREQDKSNLLRSKMKAIETFRKSKRGPGYVKKKQKVAKALKEEADLSQSSSD